MTPLERIFACADAERSLLPAFRRLISGVSAPEVVDDVDCVLRAARRRDLAFFSRTAPTKPAWCPLSTEGQCAMHRAHPASWKAVLLADPLGSAPSLDMCVCTSCLKDLLSGKLSLFCYTRRTDSIAVAYFAAFKQVHADVYSSGADFRRYTKASKGLQA